MLRPAPRNLIRHGAGALALLAIGALGACATKDSSGKDDLAFGAVHVCTSCHGMEGRSVSPTFPNLAGQQKEYLVTQLKSFRDKSRADPHARTYMFGMAAKLDDQTIDALAGYFSSRSPAPPTQGDPAKIAAGQKIFGSGIDARDVPACVGCHGANAEGDGAIPRLASQHPDYLENQLEAFQTMARANETMHENSKNLSAAEVGEVDAFLASLP